MSIPVVFRADRTGDFKGTVTAVFPTIEGNKVGYMTSYAHIGQHGICSYEWYRTTRAALPREYAALYTELKAMGYELQIIHRISRKMRTVKED